jgi:P27 family predicted phage terminase small subunit
MPRGRPPKPIALKILDGNPGKRPIKESPQPTTSVPTCPAWLDKVAKAEWARITELLVELDLVAQVDRAALAAYCQAYAELQFATELLRKEGRVVEEAIVATAKRKKKGETERLLEVVGHKKKLHPAVKLQRDAFARVKAFITEFGLTPSSRARLAVEPQEHVHDVPTRKRG